MSGKMFIVLLLFILFSVGLAYGQELVQDENWVYLKGGQGVFGVEFRKDGTVFFNNKLLMGCEYMEGAGDLYISRPSPKRGLSVVKCVHDDSAYIIDTQNKQALTKDIIPKDEALGNWVSWSPDEKYFISVIGGEVYNIVFFVLNLESGKVQKIPIKSFRTELEMHDFQDKNFSWITDNAFNFQIDIVCNPYESNCPEQNRKIIRSYNAQVNVSTSAVTYRTPKARPNSRKASPVSSSGRTAPAAQSKPTIVKASGELIQQMMRDDKTVKECVDTAGITQVGDNLSVTQVDLNGDGRFELVVESTGSPGDAMQCFLCGPRRCNLWIYQSAQDSYKLLLNSWSVDDFAALKTSTNGYLDLQVQMPAGNNFVLIRYKFDGNQYQQKGCESVDYLGERRGKPVFGRRRPCGKN